MPASATVGVLHLPERRCAASSRDDHVFNSDAQWSTPDIDTPPIHSQLVSAACALVLLRIPGTAVQESLRY